MRIKSHVACIDHSKIITQPLTMAALSSGTVTGASSSSSWASNKANVVRIFNLFRLHNPEVTVLLPKPWDELEEAVLCTNDNDIYGKFAHFLLNVYIIEAGEFKGQHLRVDNVTNYLSTSINLAKAKFLAKGSDATKLFFTCLNCKAGTAESQWLIGVKNISLAFVFNVR